MLEVSVYDADRFTRDDLVGAFSLGLLSLYMQEDHMSYRRWHALCDLRSGSSSGVQVASPPLSPPFSRRIRYTPSSGCRSEAT